MKLQYTFSIVFFSVVILFSGCDYLKRHDEKKRVYVVKSNTLNIRKGASTDFPVVGKLMQNDTIKHVKVYWEWVAILHNNDTCYVSAKHLRSIRVLDKSRVANMNLDPVSTIIRDYLNEYLDWRKLYFWIISVAGTVLSIILLKIGSAIDSNLEYYNDYDEEGNSSFPYFTGFIGILFSLLFMFWREEVLKAIFVNNLIWIPDSNFWIDWVIWSLGTLLVLFTFLTIISNLVVYKWRGIFRLLFYLITGSITLITGVFVGSALFVISIVIIILSLFTGPGPLTEEGVLGKAYHHGVYSLNYSELRILTRIFRRHGYDV